MIMNAEKLYHRAERRVDEKIKFYNKVFRYIFINSILFIVNLIFTPGIWWCSAVSLFWGIGIIVRFINVFVIHNHFDENYREMMIEKEMDAID
jgi:hypothetical protein